MFKKSLTALAVMTFLQAPAIAETQIPHWPDSDYQAHTPTIEEVLGYQAGSRISSPEAISQYFEALATAHPDQVELFEMGHTWEGRPLFYAAISTAENMARLDDIEAGMRQLADPRQTNAREAESLVNELPGSVWIAASVHGNEISPAEATLVTAYQLLADQNTETQALLDNTIVYLDPLQNPDGRARFVSRYYATIGLEPSADRQSAEHNEPWPNGRTNHYLFDLNRDWIALTQPETKARVAALQQSFPLIFVDSHEMGGDLPYYFTPEAHPYNPHITREQREGLGWIGQHNAHWFDEFGYDYFTREIFDAFYPGYGASWPLYFGSLASTYEVGSARGHRFRNHEGDEFTYGDTVQQNFVAFMATIETASDRREDLLSRFYDYRQAGIDEGSQGEIRSYLFPADELAASNQKLAALLQEQGIEVERATDSFSACGSDYQAGSYIVRAAQPAWHLIRTLLDEEVPMAEDFLAEQERRRAHNLSDQIYDVTAWSLPLMFNVEMDACNQEPEVATRTADPERILPGTVEHSEARFGFVVPWGDKDAGRFLTQALQEGLLVRSTDLPFTLADGTEYPAGSLLIPRAGNPADLPAQLADIAASSGATVTGTDRSWVTDGPNMGSANVQRMVAPNVAIAWDEPTNVLSAGSTRYILEREFGYPVTALRTAQLAGADLSQYDVLLLPATRGGSYDQALGSDGQEQLADWVADGGVLVTLGNATRFAIAGDTPLMASTLEDKIQLTEPEPLPSGSRTDGTVITTPEQQQTFIQDPHASPDWVSGVIVRANVDQHHWLTAGLPEQVHSMFIGSDIYQPVRLNHGRNVMSFAGPEELVASGHLWEENQQQIPYKPLLMVQPHGRGQVISFTQEPNFRAYVEGMHMPLLNAVFRGAAHARPVR